MINRTLCFLVKRDASGKVKEVCLGMKKIGFGQGIWVGIGGKIKKDEAIKDAVIRETEEEICVKVRDIKKVAETDFRFPHKPDWSQYVYVYMTDSWDGEVGESEEIKPQWFRMNEIPYSGMWEDAQYWLPQVLSGEKIKGVFTYGRDDCIFEKSIEPLQ